MQHTEFFDTNIINLYNKYNIKIKNLIVLNNNKEYSACEFTINNKKILFRKCKQTPKKIGHFVSIWIHNNDGKNIPYDIKDKYDI